MITLNMLERTKRLLSRVSLSIFNVHFDLLIKHDNKCERQFFDWIKGEGEEPRVYVQLGYWSKCCKTGEEEYWKSRKWYLSEHMTDDEIIKTCYAMFELAVKHELLECFKVDGKSLFNPHLDFEELLLINHKEKTRV